MVSSPIALFLLLMTSASLNATDEAVNVSSFTEGAKPWKWTIFLTGTPEALAHIVCVQYILDPSLPNNHQTVCQRGAKDRSFASSGTTFGSFSLSAAVSFDDKKVKHIKYVLNPQASPQADNRLPQGYHLSGWHPTDMTPDPVAGVLVLDGNGTVSRVLGEDHDAHREVLFSINPSWVGVAVTANERAIFLAANSAVGCSIFRYTFLTKAVDQKSASQDACSGIAVEGEALYVVTAIRGSIEHWDNWTSSSSNRIVLPDDFTDASSAMVGSLIVDKWAQRLLVGETTGGIYSISVPAGKSSLIISGVGWVASLAANANHIFVATGKKILVLSRADNRGENPPPILQTLTGGNISGVAIDGRGNLWFSDKENGLVVGPLIVN